MLIHTRAGGSESDCGKKTEDVIAKHILQKKNDFAVVVVFGAIFYG